MPIFKDNDFHWVEAPLPVDDLDRHARFQGFGIPIGGGDLALTTRYEYEEAFIRGKIDIAQPDVTMAGGITELMRTGKVRPLFGSEVTEILENRVRLRVDATPVELPNDYVFVFAGGDPPFELLRQMGVRFGGDAAPPVAGATRPPARTPGSRS